jgi:hypothetical protein
MIRLVRRSKQEFLHNLGEGLRNSHPVPPAFQVLVAPSIYMGLPERGRSEGDSFGNGATSRLALSEQSIL